MGLPLRFHPVSLFQRLRSTYWFVPSLVTLGCMLLAWGLLRLDRSGLEVNDKLGWLYSGGSDGARALLSAVAGSIITVVSVTFSVMVVALTVSSQHFGPRMLNNFMRDNRAQMVLGTFTGTFAYCLIVLRTVQGDGGEHYERFVPHASVTAALALSLVSVGMLIYYVHHVARSLQVSEMTADVARDLTGAVDRLYPERFGQDADVPPDPAPAPPVGAWEIAAESSGYVQEIGDETVLALAREHDTTIWLTSRPGDFVVEGTRLALVGRRPDDPDDFAHRLRDAYVMGVDRTSVQDVGFSAQQLTEVALRALSTGVNEPFTAITCIDRLTQGLLRLAGRRIPSPVRLDDEGNVRVVTKPQDFRGLLEASFEPIAQFGADNPAIVERLLTGLAVLARGARRPEDLEAIERIAGFALAAAERQITHEPHLRRLSAHHHAVLRALQPQARG